MKHKPFSALLIPDTGEAKPTPYFEYVTHCRAHARTEAKVMLRCKPIQSVEIVVLKHRTALAEFGELVRRTA